MALSLWSPSIPFSSSSKQRKNVISCVTVHDSPDSDCSSNNSPYTVESRLPNNNSYDTKTTLLDNYNNGNPRTIIIPPLKTQTGEVSNECERLMPGKASEVAIKMVNVSFHLPTDQIYIPSCADSMNHQNIAYKFKCFNGMVSGNNHLQAGVTGGGSYRQQRSGPHPLQQQPLNLSQV